VVSLLQFISRVYPVITTLLTLVFRFLLRLVSPILVVTLLYKILDKTILILHFSLIFLKHCFFLVFYIFFIKRGYPPKVIYYVFKILLLSIHFNLFLLFIKGKFDANSYKNRIINLENYSKSLSFIVYYLVESYFLLREGAILSRDLFKFFF